MSGINATDPYSKNILQTRMEKMIGEEFIKKNLAQLFRIFPDSAVHVGDNWELESKQGGDFGLNIKTDYILKEIDNGIATIESKASLVSDSSENTFMGSGATAELKGEQRGEYQMDITTGMIVSSNINAELEGTVQAMGREIPVTMKMKAKMKGKKVN